MLTTLFSSPTKVRRGSLVIAIVSLKGDYVVVAADSRNLTTMPGSGGAQPDDRACKVISLGGDTLFFETGHTYIRVYRGQDWNGLAVASITYRESKRNDAEALSTAWGKKASEWFNGQPKQDLRDFSGPNGMLLTGWFVNFTNDGSPSVKSQEVYYSSATNSVVIKPGPSPAPGQAARSGIAQDLVGEFFAQRTKRAIDAFGPIDASANGTNPRYGLDPTNDSDVAARAIQFAIDNSIGKDKAALGGPIDVAVIRKGGAIQWVSRKEGCYEQDLKANLPSPTKGY